MVYIFYQTKTKFSNTGDALINRALICELRKYGQVCANCNKSIPNDFLDELGLLSEERLDVKNEMDFVCHIFKAAIVALFNKDTIYFVSGLGDFYGRGPRLVLKNLISSAIMAIYRILKVETVRIGRSVGVITKPVAFSERVRSAFVKYNYVRDTMSLKRCKNFGINKIKLCPDLSWIFMSDTDRAINETTNIIISLRESATNDKDKKYSNALVKRCKEYLPVFKDAFNSPMKIYVVYQVEEDGKFARNIYNIIKKDYDVELVDHQLKLDELQTYYGRSAYHISNRMHSILMGYKYGSLPVAVIDIDKHIKISSTMKDCDLEEMMFDVYSFEKEKLKELIKNRKFYFHKIAKCEESNTVEIRKILNYIFKKKK